MAGSSGIALRSARVLARMLLAVVFAGLAPAAHAADEAAGDEIRLGQSAPLTGAFASLGTANSEGAALYFDHVNRSGGVGGRRIRLITLDDGYDPARTEANAKRLVEQDRVLALFSINGTPTSMKALEVAEAAGVPFLFPFSGAEAVRKPRPLAFHLRASYAQEIDRMVDLAAGTGVTRFAVAYLDNLFGKEGLAAAQAALARHKLTPVAAVPLAVANPDLGAAAKALQAAEPAVVIVAAAGAVVPGIIDAHQKTGQAAQFYCLSVVSNDLLLKVLGERAHGVVVAQVVPFPWDMSIPLVREYHALLREKGSKPSFPGFEGFIAAKATAEGLKRAGPRPTRASLAAAVQGMRTVDLGGVVVDYSGDRRTNATAMVDLTIVARDGRFLR
jgi:ABC-type branched-subunit amino acid transport system substrate-binding protein